MPEFHSEIGGSNAARVLACPASVRLSRGVPDAGGGHAAQEGTALHAAALTLLQGLGERAARAVLAADPSTSGTEGLYEDVLLPAVEAARAIIAGREILTEDWAPFPSLGGNGGTADLVVLDAEGRVAAVLDFKFGRRKVPAKGNAQLRFYAACAGAGAGRQYTHQGDIRLYIIQPRVSPMVAEDAIRPPDMFGWMNDMLRAYQAVEAAAPVPGAHCRFCRAAPNCPALAADIEVTVAAPVDTATLGLNLAQLARVKDWVAAVEEASRSALQADNGAIPGWKMVRASAGARSWGDEAGAAKLLEAAGVEAYAPRKLIGIPAAEKALGKDAVAPLTRPGKPSYTIVAADDPRAPDNGSLTSGKAILL